MSDKTWENIGRLYYLTDRLERIKHARRKRILINIGIGISLLTTVGVGSYLYIVAIF
jgi:hypothetical protein